VPDSTRVVQTYPVRASHRKNLTTPGIAEILRGHFEGVTTDGESVTGHWGAIDRLVVRPAGRDIAIELAMNPRVPEDVARETIGRYNRFLEAATGFSAKERARRLRKSAGASDGA
jgi:hypothetical protein